MPSGTVSSTRATDRQGAEELLLEETWTAFEVAAQGRLANAWSPAPVPIPGEWRGYHVTRTRVIRRALRLFDSQRPQPVAPVPTPSKTRIEQPVVEQATGLQGTPDRVEGAAGDRCVVDLKTGLEQAEATEGQRRQLLLYAHMVTVDEGAPTRIAIEAVVAGQRWEERITTSDVEGAVAQAVDARGRFNAAALAGTSEHLAEPGPDTCRFCTYRPVCGPLASLRGGLATGFSDWPGQRLRRGGGGLDPSPGRTEPRDRPRRVDNHGSAETHCPPGGRPCGHRRR